MSGARTAGVVVRAAIEKAKEHDRLFGSQSPVVPGFTFDEGSVLTGDEPFDDGILCDVCFGARVPADIEQLNYQIGESTLLMFFVCRDCAMDPDLIALRTVSVTITAPRKDQQ